ncbi:MAG: aquaporin [Chthoniobacter sp.]
MFLHRAGDPPCAGEFAQRTDRDSRPAHRHRAIFSPAVVGKGLAGGLPPFLVGGVVWAIGLSLGGATGYAINPARDLAPRIAHAILPIPGKGSSDWSYAWIPVVGPLLGAVVAGVWLPECFLKSCPEIP